VSKFLSSIKKTIGFYWPRFCIRQSHLPALTSNNE
jgi:hypothetical protein